MTEAPPVPCFPTVLDDTTSGLTFGQAAQVARPLRPAFEFS